MGNKIKPSKAWRKDQTAKTKGKLEIPSNCNHDIKYFKCLKSKHIASQYLNKRIMVMREHRDIKFKSNKYEEDEMPPLEAYSDVEYPIDEEALVIRRSLNVQIKKDDVE